MLDVTGYMMPQDITTEQMQPPITLDPNAVVGTAGGNSAASKQNLNDSSPQNNDNGPVEDTKPKRGRPRKKRDKKHLTPEEENAKRQKFLERNRLAASKCRDRKKNWTQDTMDKLAREERIHVEMQLEYNHLHVEVVSLMEAACEHLGHCSDKDMSFQNSLSLISERIAAIGRMYSGMNGIPEQEEQDDSGNEEDAGTSNSDERPRKRARGGSERESSVIESVRSLADSVDPATVPAAVYINHEAQELKHQMQLSTKQQDQDQARSYRMSRQGSSNSAGSSGDGDSGISVRGSPIKSKFLSPTDEGFFGSDDSKSVVSAKLYHTMPVVRSNPHSVHQGAQAKLDALLFPQNFALARSVGSSEATS
jgi:hypothetical protein